MIDLQRRILLDTIRATTGHDSWKVLVLDEGSKKIVDNVAKEDDILNENVTNIEQVEHKRSLSRDTDAVYLISPLPYIVDCIMADFERRRYRKCYLIWTSELPHNLKERLDRSQMARQQIAAFRILDIDFFPRESHLITFRDPWSFPVLFRPDCSHLVKDHLDGLAHRIVSVCVSLGEYPTIKYYRPKAPTHEASVLCSHLARFVQDELDNYARRNSDTFPTPSPRPRAVLIITDRSMDLMAPLVHEFTYQAMALDLLNVSDGDRVTYRNVINKGQVGEEEKEVELGEKDRIWVTNRHMHMKDLLGKIVEDFKKFRADNPQFDEVGGAPPASVNTIKDMLAGLPQYQEGKEAFGLHLDMAEKCVNKFQETKLLDVGSVEQSLSTGLDEDYKRPKNLADQMVRLLDDESVTLESRCRLLIMYILYRGGILRGDVQKLMQHGQLPPTDAEAIYNLELLGAPRPRALKDTTPPPVPLFQVQPPAMPATDEVSLSRFEPALRLMLEEQCRGTLDPQIFPPVKPHLDGPMQDNISSSSLRSAQKPTWARTRPAAHEPRQRIVVFMAGGATYSEARACYEVSHMRSKEVYLASSHMITPKLFLRQVGDLSVDRRRLDIPAERPPMKAPAHLFEREPQPVPQQAPKPSSFNQQPAGARSQPVPTLAMGAMNLGPGDGNTPRSTNGSSVPTADGAADRSGKLKKDKDKDKDKDKKKKKHLHLF